MTTAIVLSLAELALKAVIKVCETLLAKWAKEELDHKGKIEDEIKNELDQAARYDPASDDAVAHNLRAMLLTKRETERSRIKSVSIT